MRIYRRKDENNRWTWGRVGRRRTWVKARTHASDRFGMKIKKTQNARTFNSNSNNKRRRRRNDEKFNIYCVVEWNENRLNRWHQNQHLQCLTTSKYFLLKRTRKWRTKENEKPNHFNSICNAKSLKPRRRCRRSCSSSVLMLRSAYTTWNWNVTSSMVSIIIFNLQCFIVYDTLNTAYRPAAIQKKNCYSNFDQIFRQHSTAQQSAVCQTDIPNIDMPPKNTATETLMLYTNTVRWTQKANVFIWIFCSCCTLARKCEPADWVLTSPSCRWLECSLHLQYKWDYICFALKE